MRDNDVIAILSLQALILFVIALGFNEVFNRLRPRVVYVYTEKKDDIPIWNKRAKDDAMRSRVPDAAPS